MVPRTLYFLITISIFSFPLRAQRGAFLDFSEATILSLEDPSALQARAVGVLREEVEKRTDLELGLSDLRAGGDGAVIFVGRRADLTAVHGTLRFLGSETPPGPEGYIVTVLPEGPTAVVAGEDDRGVLYGVGRLLREAYWSSGKLMFPADLRIASAPKFPVRGHQLGNRDVNNTYDAWVPADYDQYIRDLALFGANSIEIIPPNLADFPAERSNRRIPAEEMMIRLVEIIDSYGMDVWVFYPNSVEGREEWFDPDDSLFQDPDFVQQELDRRDAVFRKLRKVNGVLVPAGDPGSLSPDVLFSWLGKVSVVLRKHHPQAKIWVSHQLEQSDPALYESFYENVNRKPSWLGGVVFGPWGRTPLPEMRRIVDPSIPIRRYPDITHAMACQYPIHGYDRAFALTLGREPIMPRPLAFKHIHNLFDEYAIGSIAYSEGVNDDVNKFIWLDQDWDPETPAARTMREYSRLFIDPDQEEELAQALIALERNLDGSLLENPHVGTTLRQWQALEVRVRTGMPAEFRFQMGLLRAYYDAYTRSRLIHELALENRALEILGQARERGSLAAIAEAESLLRPDHPETLWSAYRERCVELAGRLRENIGIQLGVERYGAVRKERSAIIDSIDEPLTDSPYLLSQIEAARRPGSEEERLKAIDAFLNRANPGAGNFYDDFGDYPSWERVVIPPGSRESDPGTLQSARRSFTYGGRRSTLSWVPRLYGGDPDPLSWFTQVSSLFDQPLRIRYQNLDPKATYRIRAVHARVHPLSEMQVRLEADGYLVHDLIEVGDDPVLEYRVPREATGDGEVVFSWTCGFVNKRCSVAEVWLVREGEH